MNRQLIEKERVARRWVWWFEELEPRLVCSADANPVPLDFPFVEPSFVAADSALPELQQDTFAALAARRHELVFVDSRVDHAQDLLADLGLQSDATRWLEVVLLDADRDGLEQVSEALRPRLQLDAVHFVSHGADGALQLGVGWLDAGAVATQAERIARWGDALKENADLLFYGCDLAASPDGQALLDALASLTGADVAASSDATGNAARGGDLDLEYRVGAIEASPQPARQTVARWDGLLNAVPVGSESLVNSVTTNTQQAAAIAMDAAGNYVAVWQSNEISANGSDIYARRYDALGNAQGAAFLVNTTNTSNEQQSPTVAMDAAGNFVVAWQSLGQDGSNWGIFAQRYNFLGLPVGGEIPVNSFKVDAQQSPAVAIAATTGDFVVAWQSFDQDDPIADWGVYAQRYNAAGAAQGSEFRVNTETKKDQEAPTVAMDATGAFVVAWQSDKQDGNGFGVYAQRYASTGAAQGGEFLVNTTTLKNQKNPAAAMDSSGNFVIAWQSARGTLNTDAAVYAQRYDATGSAQGGELLVNTYTSDRQTAPAVAMDPLGDFVITWQSRDQDGDGYGIYKQEFTAAGARDGGESRVNTTTSNNQRAPAIATNATGDFVIVWDGEGVGDATGVFARRYDETPVIVNVPPVVALSPLALSYIENDPPTAIDGGATVVDLDSPDFNSGVLSVELIAGGTADDRLAIRNQGTGVGEIGLSANTVAYEGAVIGTWTGGIGTAPLVVAFNANTSLAAAQALLRNITYANVSDGPATAPRTVRFEITDGEGGKSAPAQKTINVIAVNDSPMVSSDGGGATATRTVSENTTAVTDVNATDPDVPVQSLTYSIVGGADAARFSIDATTGALSFVVAPDFEIPGDADADNLYLVTVQVDDGAAGIGTQALTVGVTDVNEAPVLASTGTALGYVENAPPIAIDSNIIISDDSATLQSASVRLTGGYVIGEDVLSFAGAPGLAALWSASAGTLTLTGSAPVATWQDALRSVVYLNASENPSAAARTLGVTVNDGTFDSVALTRTLNVTPVNDAPAIGVNTLNVASGGAVVITTVELSATDPDTAQPGLTFNVADVANGRFELIGAPGAAITQFTTAQLSAGQVRFVHAGNDAAPMYTVRVSDGTLLSSPSAVSVSFAAPPIATTAQTTAAVVPASSPAIAAANPLPSSSSGGTSGTSAGQRPAAASGLLAATAEATFPTAPGAALAEARAALEVPQPAVVAEAPRMTVAQSAALAISNTLPAFRSLPVGEGLRTPQAATPEPTAAPTALQLQAALTGQGFQRELDRVRNEVDHKLAVDKNVVAVGVSVSTGLSVGYVFWMVRGGLLVSSLLSSIPAWRMIDPLPILGAAPRADDDDAQDDEDSLPSLLRASEARRERERLARNDPTQTVAASELKPTEAAESAASSVKGLKR